MTSKGIGQPLDTTASSKTSDSLPKKGEEGVTRNRPVKITSFPGEIMEEIPPK